MAWILLKPSNYKQVAPLVRTCGSRHTGLAALPHRNIQSREIRQVVYRHICCHNPESLICHAEKFGNCQDH